MENHAEVRRRDPQRFEEWRRTRDPQAFEAWRTGQEVTENPDASVARPEDQQESNDADDQPQP